MSAFDYSIDKKFNITFKKISRQPLSWLEELHLSASLIAQSTNKPIYILMSGGLDSEVTARAFLKQNIPFKALTLKHKEGTNKYDTDFADSFCKEYGIEQSVLTISIKNFFENDINKYISQGYHANNVYHYIQLILLEHIEELGGFGVGGAGEQVYYTKDGVINLKYNPSYVLAKEWIKKNNTKHNLWMMSNTPELYLAYTKIDLIDTLLKNPIYFQNHHFGSLEKQIVYHGYWPDMVRRVKTGGFQNVSTYRTSTEQQLNHMFPHLANGDLYIPIDKMKQELNG